MVGCVAAADGIPADVSQSRLFVVGRVIRWANTCYLLYVLERIDFRRYITSVFLRMFPKLGLRANCRLFLGVESGGKDVSKG